MTLPMKRQRFVEEYLVDMNATEAAIRAGYSKKTAYAQGHRLLKHVEIEAAISAARAEQSQRTQITADAVLQQLARFGFADIRQLFNEHGQLRAVHELPDEVAAAVASIEVVTKQLPAPDGEGPEVEYVHKIKLVDKVKPLELIGKHLAMWIENHNHRFPQGGVLAVPGMMDAEQWEQLFSKQPQGRK